MLQPSLPFSPFRNQGLFTDHYLHNVLPTSTDLWVLDGMEAVRTELQTLWQEQQDKVAGYNEAQLEEHFIRPFLRILGHVWQVQPSAGSHQPDYSFFLTETDRDAAQQADKAGGKEYWWRALAVGDAKAWDVKLDKADKGGKDWNFQNPSFQIYYYLAETGCKWAILTNGRHWRLYCGEPKPNMQAFYEVDLPALLEADNPQALAYFYLFFRQDAFIPGLTNQSFLDKVRTESDLSAEKLREDVKEGVYRALLEVCRGFMVWEDNKLSDAAINDVYDNALVLLYRLLFTLYAEAAELLPVRENTRYHNQYSLHAIKNKIADTGKTTYLNDLVTLWPQLKSLFTVIDKGNQSLGVPAYNGGLFDAEKHPFLDKYELTDKQIAKVIDLMARTSDGNFVDYRDLGVRHLGSIYEGLLEYKLARATEPMVVIRDSGKESWVPEQAVNKTGIEHCMAGDFYLVTDKGERKVTGSYYTPQFIVEYIVENTVGPLAEACQTQDEVLNLKVLDPAMGSGHFLVEVTDYLARKLFEKTDALVAAQSTEEADIAYFKRLVVERCIFGVDINPLAVELAKLSLWLDTVAKGQPLSFLDHHLRCGNSLIGAQVKKLPVAPELKTSKKKQADIQLPDFDNEGFTDIVKHLKHGFDKLSQGLSDTREAVHQKAEELAEIEETYRKPVRKIADLWCSRFFGNEYSYLTYNGLVKYLQDENAALNPLDEPALLASEELAKRYRFFHWELEFPECFFDEQGQLRSSGGFDAVVGNPPWERIKLQENEFFALRAPQISLAPTAAKRKVLVQQLRETNPELWDEYEQAKKQAEMELAWTRISGQYPFMGKGDTNLYAVMTERGRSLLKPLGAAGFVVPSGIATDITTASFFTNLVDTKTLQVLLDFENREGIFPDVDSRFKLSIIIMTGGAQRKTFSCGFFLHNLEEMQDPERVFPMHPDDCSLMNPNTRTCPIFRTINDVNITREIYRRVPVLVRDVYDKTGNVIGEENPWGVRYATMFHMTNDSHLFRTAVELEAEGYYPVAGNAWKKGTELYLPLYVGKMVRQYDHRAAIVEYHQKNITNPYVAVDTSDDDKKNPMFSVLPYFYIPQTEVDKRSGVDNWILAYRNISRPTDERSMIASINPYTGFGNALGLLLPTNSKVKFELLLANLNSFILDYCVRLKMGGTNMNFFIVRQLPVLPPERYDEVFHGVRLADFIAQRVLELTYTAHDIAGFAEDLGYVDETGKVKPPFTWDEERRLHLRCQLDALYFHLYGLTREEADYVLETFPIVKRHDQDKFGKYRTKELILHYYNAYSAGDMQAWVEG